MSDLVRLCAWCPPGDARPATAACPRCGRPLCDDHRIRESTPPSRCDWCEAEFRRRIESGWQLWVTIAFAMGPMLLGIVLLATGSVMAGAAAFILGPMVGVAVRAYQRRIGAMRRRFLAERADLLPPARLVERRPGD